MKSNRKRLFLAGGVAVFLLLTIVIASEPVRSALRSVFSETTAGGATTAVSTALTALDTEQRVRTRHGWNSTLQNSVITGQISFFNRAGQQTGQANITLYRKYPNLMRAVIVRGTSVETVGFDATQAWKSGKAGLSEAEARDIRAWLRLWPERLFTLRSAGARYREAGKRVEEVRPSTPWQAAAQIDPPAVLEQVEIQDTIGAGPDAQRVGDRRSVYYYIDQSSLIRSARWLEPDDPRARADDRRAAKTDCRTDFGNWLQMGGVMWPMEITRWLGGTVAFRIQVDEVKVNQPVTDSMFQNPGR